MGITHADAHKRKKTGGKKKVWHKKRKYEMGRQAAKTKLSSDTKVTSIRTRGGHIKKRALRLDSGKFHWASEACNCLAHIHDVVYHAHSNEIMRTKTLVKGSIVQVSAQPFKEWYKKHYGVEIGAKGPAGTIEKQPNFNEMTDIPEKELSKMKENYSNRKPLDPVMVELLSTGRLLACISTRPGQIGRADGYILEGKELEFYKKKILKKKGQKD